MIDFSDPEDTSATILCQFEERVRFSIFVYDGSRDTPFFTRYLSPIFPVVQIRVLLSFESTRGFPNIPLYSIFLDPFSYMICILPPSLYTIDFSHSDIRDPSRSRPPEYTEL